MSVVKFHDSKAALHVRFSVFISGDSRLNRGAGLGHPGTTLLTYIYKRSAAFRSILKTWILDALGGETVKESKTKQVIH